MRKLLLISAIVLMSGTAHSEPWRSLSLASDKNAEQFVERPKAVQPEKPVEQIKEPQTQPQADAKPTADAKSSDAKPAEVKSTEVKPAAAKLKHKHVSTEARIISELHRHGIYW
jgi:hypothetical protein